ncbi:MAG: Hpt domain-containing protein [Chloroflexi bacterium]|nr:Hpt domain-containing protein [Chloroflexota bacterium]
MVFNSDRKRDDKAIVYVEEELADLIPGFLDNRWNDVEAIDEALATRDYETVRVLGHSMKGSGGGYGFGAITDIGKSLEVAAKERDAEEIRKWLKELAYYLEIVEVEYE